MDTQIQKELRRIVGGDAVSVADVETSEASNRRVWLETANARYEVPEKQLLVVLQKLPDRIGVVPLREAIEENFPRSEI